MLFGQLSYLLHLNGDSIKTLRIYVNLANILGATNEMGCYCLCNEFKDITSLYTVYV
jgi:hypothetical protein